MSLIRARASDKDTVAAKLFDDHIVPLAERCRRSGITFFPIAPDEQLDTYFVVPARSDAHASDFELDGIASLDAFVASLTQLWASQGYDMLTETSPRLARLAHMMAEGEQESAELSQAAYVMF